MLAAQTVIVEQTPIHWEAVLITAVPAALAFFGSVGAALIGRRNKQHLKAIDSAVNGVAEGEPTLREKVEKIDTAVNGAAEGDPSIRQNVETLTARRDLDPKAKP